jgi:hypothetical protein
MSTQLNNPLAALENLFWEIGRLFILYFLTIFALLFKQLGVIDWAVEESENKRTIYCPPVTFFILTVAFAIAMAKFVFYQETFDALISSEIFSNVFLKGSDIQGLILAFGVVAIIFPLDAVLVLVLMGRQPTLVRVATLTRLLLYYWGIFFFSLLIFYIVLLYFFQLHFLSTTALIGSWVIAAALAGIFGRSLKKQTERPYWHSLAVIFITQAVAPIVSGGLLVHGALVHNWTMQQKFEAADIVGVAYVEKKAVLDKAKSFGEYAIREGLSVIWKDVWKGQARLDDKKLAGKLISIPSIQRGQILSIDKGKQYLVFLQLYRGLLIPLKGSPAAVYGISTEQKLIAYGLRDTITGRKRLAQDSIDVEAAKQKLLAQH